MAGAAARAVVATAATVGSALSAVHAADSQKNSQRRGCELRC
jgi:hypothetical protein